MKKSLPVNRVAALGGTVAAVTAAVVSVLGAVDSTPKAVVVSVALVVVGAVVCVFLLGSQKHEARANQMTDDQVKAAWNRRIEQKNLALSGVPSSAGKGHAIKADPEFDPDPNPPSGPDPTAAQPALDGGKP